MPLYEYKCSKCSTVFEVIQRFSDEPLATHEGCGGAVERLISRSALQFKGSGWYVNDYAKGSSRSPAGKAENGSNAKSGDSSKGGDTSKGSESTKGDSKSSSDSGSAPSAPSTSTSTSDSGSGSSGSSSSSSKDSGNK